MLICRLSPCAIPSLLVLVLAGCGASESPGSAQSEQASVVRSPSETSRLFLEAVDEDKRDALAAYLTKGAQAALTKEDGLAFQGERMDSFEIGTESIAGEAARVSVVVHQQEEAQAADLLMRKEDGEWRIHGMHIAFGDGGFTLDFEEMSGMLEDMGEQLGEALTEQFEKAFDDMKVTMEQGGTSEEIAAERAQFEGLKAVSLAEFDASWRVDLKGAGRSARALLEEVLAPVSFPMQVDGFEKALATPLDLNLEQVSRVEAVEAIAAAVGLQPKWPDLEWTGFGTDQDENAVLQFKAGLRALPAVFAGPFLVEVVELDEHAPRPTGTLVLAMRGLGLEPVALTYQTEMGQFLRVDRLRSAEDVALTDEDLQYWSSPKTEGQYLTYRLERDLTGLLRSVEKIDVLSGEVLFTIPTGIEELTLDAKLREQPTDAGQLRVTDWDKNVQFEIVGTEESLQALAIRMSPRQASGDPLGTLYSSANGWGTKLQAHVQCPEPPTALDVKLCTEATLHLPFELHDIALQRFQEQPERIEQLQFAGASPIFVELVGGIRRDGGQGEVTLKLVNRSNKDALSVLVKFLYVDSKNEVLSDFPHTLAGDYDFERSSTELLVEAGETVEKSSFAAFLPENATGVRFEVQTVEFPDGTSWQEPD